MNQTELEDENLPTLLKAVDRLARVLCDGARAGAVKETAAGDHDRTAQVPSGPGARPARRCGVWCCWGQQTPAISAWWRGGAAF